MSPSIKKQVKQLSEDLREAQKGLRILKAIRWPKEFEAKFREQTGAPTIDSLNFDFKQIPLSFECDPVLERVDELRSTIKALPEENADVGRIFLNMCDDFEYIAHMLEARGTAEFGEYSKKLYGHPGEVLFSDGTTICEFAERFKKNLDKISDEETEKRFPKVLTAHALAQLIDHRLMEAHLPKKIQIKISADTTSDAAAGPTYLKLREGAHFSIKDVDVLVYHEAFIHIATSMNGRSQRHAKWLSFDSPRCTATQEGLAVLMEILSAKTYPRRLRKIVNRILMIEMITKGESVESIYEFLMDDGYKHQDALTLILRSYRGCDPEARSPFTKDVSYLKGLIQVFNYMQASLTDNRYDDIAAFFTGKLSIYDIPAISAGFESGLVNRPLWMPSVFLDLDSLAGWFTYVSALGSMGDVQMRNEFRQMRKQR